jgi:hypothetical protein
LNCRHFITQSQQSDFGLRIEEKTSTDRAAHPLCVFAPLREEI